MLTPAEIASLRRGVEAAQRRPWKGPWEWATCADGPLQGLRVRLDRCDSRPPGYVFGWCQPTATGPVVAYYEQGDAPGEWRFQGYEAPGRWVSGRPAA